MDLTVPLCEQLSAAFRQATEASSFVNQQLLNGREGKECSALLCEQAKTSKCMHSMAVQLCKGK